MLQLHGGFRVRVKVSVRVLFHQTLDEWMGPKVHFFLKLKQLAIVFLSPTISEFEKQSSSMR